jgi:hypothetical protein
LATRSAFGPWHDLARSIPLAFIAPLVGAIVVACGSRPVHPKATRAEVLQTLRQCLAEFPKRTPDISPCAYRDLYTLNGISRVELIAGLGGVPACQTHQPMPLGFFRSNLGGKPECEQDEDPFWTFFVQPMAVSGSGWPFLVCEAEGTANCVRVA